MELLQLEDVDSDDNDQEDRTTRVKEWIEQGAATTQKIEAEPATKANLHESSGTTVDIRMLAQAITKAVSTSVSRSGGATPPKFLNEIPAFDGNISEWIAFRTVYEDSAPLFTSIQNMARLRRCLKGTAREAIKSLLYSDCKPEEIIEALRRRFGRAEALVLHEMEKLKTTQTFGEPEGRLCFCQSSG